MSKTQAKRIAREQHLSKAERNALKTFDPDALIKGKVSAKFLASTLALGMSAVKAEEQFGQSQADRRNAKLSFLRSFGALNLQKDERGVAITVYLLQHMYPRDDFEIAEDGKSFSFADTAQPSRTFYYGRRDDLTPDGESMPRMVALLGYDRKASEETQRKRERNAQLNKRVTRVVAASVDKLTLAFLPAVEGIKKKLDGKALTIAERGKLHKALNDAIAKAYATE